MSSLVVESDRRALVLDRATLHGILQAAVTAPSPENVQSWRFRPTPHGFVVLHDRKRGQGLGRGRTRDIAYLLSVGALVEAARIKAKSLGLDVTYSLLPPDRSRDELESWVEVRLAPGEAVSSPLLPMLEQRYSHRGPLAPSSVSDEQLEALERTGTRTVLVRTTSDPPRRGELARLAAVADQIRAENEASHEYLHEWLRWTKDEAERTRDGLDVRTLGLQPIELAALRFLRPWARMRRLIPLGASKLQGRYGGRMMRASAGLGWIVVPSLDRGVLVEAGVVMERAWLTATEMALALSPLSVLALLPLMAMHDDPALAPDHVRVLARIHERVQRALGLESTQEVVFFFRLGKADPPPVRTLRRSVDELVLDTSDA